MRKKYVLTAICVLAMILATHGIAALREKISKEKDSITVGFLYVGDSCNTYTNNFLRAQKAIELEYGERVRTIAKYNVAEGDEEQYLKELVDEECDLIFATSYGYEDSVKRLAEAYPDVTFCMATGDNANEEPVLKNYHNFMGEIYQGRYISGVVAGMKLAQLIDEGVLDAEDVTVGYVGAYPYAEVISGYTAFLMGVRSVVPTAVMRVVYTYSWGDYNLEKSAAEQLIKEGCVVISQHSDTTGPAVACEEMSKDHIVYHVGYNQSMTDVAPTTSLISSRINWQYYMLDATEAVLKGKSIESVADGNVHGNDVSGGIKEKWIQLLKLNDTIAAEGTQEKIDELIQKFCNNKITVFKGDYIGVDPFDENDTIDLKNGYIENHSGSSPSFHYVLKDVIIVEE